MYSRLIAFLCFLCCLFSCEQETIIDDDIITISIINPNNIPVAITTTEGVFLDSIASGDTSFLTLIAQPYTFFKAYSTTSSCFKEFTFINGKDGRGINAPLFTQCDDGDLYIISVLDSLEYFLISRVLDELYPSPSQINIYQRTADSDGLIDFERYFPDEADIARDTLVGFPIDSATTSDYWRKNYEYDRWFNFRNSRVKVLPRSELRCLLRYYDLNNGGFNAGDYDCKYPSIPLFQFSRVGLNETRNQGLVSFFDNESTRRVLVELQGDKWQIVAAD
jgi:hypothetical protein